MTWKLFFILTLLVVSHCKKQHYKDLKRKKQECSRLEVCKFDETDNCLNRCISERCFELVYGDDPPEPGQVDKQKFKSFNDCLRNEDRESRAKHRDDL